MTACALYVAHVGFVLIEGSVGLGAGVTLILYCVIYVVGMVVLCRDFERLLEQPGSPSMEMMTTLMAVLFGAYYFQFHLHELALQQRALPSDAEPT